MFSFNDLDLLMYPGVVRKKSASYYAYILMDMSNNYVHSEQWRGVIPSIQDPCSYTAERCLTRYANVNENILVRSPSVIVHADFFNDYNIWTQEVPEDDPWLLYALQLAMCTAVERPTESIFTYDKRLESPCFLSAKSNESSIQQ